MATIKVYARIHPCLSQTTLVDVQEKRLLVSKSLRSSIPRNAAEIGFTFDQIFNANSTQSEVFDNSAKDIVEKFIEGYNGTIFAYGQTGCGKTYTIEGEELSSDRSPKHGIIPQTLAFIFKELQNIKDECATIKVSFLEMYNETAYDLLGPLMYGTRNTRDLPKVLVSQGTGGSCHLHGLSIHEVNTEYEARKLHMNGRSNRSVAWTSSNDRSSRSHAIFTILLTRQKQDSELIVKSKLNLVDLAGSESLSIKKDGSVATTLNTETKHINLSLHYLETVIIALQRIYVQGIRSRSASRDDSSFRGKRCQSAHILPTQLRDRPGSSTATNVNSLKCSSAIGFTEMRRKGSSINAPTSPYISYRNSLLTMLLQDSLGGNCNTSMIATLSLETHNINETILTCRFAQRVARVTNNPVINKTVNEEALIKLLQSKVTKLSKELVMLKQNGVDTNNNQAITSEDKSIVIAIVHSYLEGTIEDPVDQGINDSQKIRACLSYLKDLVIQNKHGCDATCSEEKDSGVGTNSVPTNNSYGEPYSPALTDGSGTTNDNTNMPTSTEPIQTIESPPPERNTHSASSSQRFFPPSSNPAKQLNSPSSQTKNSAPSSCENMATDGEREATPQSSVSQNTSGKAKSCVIMSDSQMKLILLELELKKENLIHKSKLLSTALSNQRARIMVMEKHGCLPDEIDNERLAEQQLMRKQAQVEQRLSVVVKKIVEKTSGKNIIRHDIMKNHPENPPFDEHTLKQHNLELQEQSTRQKLIAYRDKLIPGLLCQPGQQKTSICPSAANVVPSLTTLNKDTMDKSMNRFESHTECTSSPEEQIDNDSYKQDKRTVRTENSFETKHEMKTPKKSYARVMSAGPRSISPPERRRKNTGRVPKKSQFMMPKTSTLKIGVMSENRKQSSNLLMGRTQLRRTSSLPQINNNDTKTCAKEGEGKALKKPSINSNIPMSVRRSALPSRTRRPAMCSPVFMSKNHSTRPPSRNGSPPAHYECEPDNGFILRTNSMCKVYRNSSFKKDDLSLMSQRQSRTPNLRGGREVPKTSHISPGYGREVQKTFHLSPAGGREDTQRTSNLSFGSSSQESMLNDDLSHGGGGQDTEKSCNSSLGSSGEDDQWTCNSARERSSREAQTCNSSPGVDSREEETVHRDKQFPPTNSSANVNGAENDPLSETHDNIAPKEAAIKHKVPPSVLRARKQQLERAKRIREVTNAVEVIQGAYRRYRSLKKG